MEPRLIHIAETDSTNRFMWMVADAELLASGSIVLADFQTAGRGLSGNSWESEAKQNLTFSVLSRPVAVPASRPFLIAEMAALSVRKTLEKYLPTTNRLTVKWPNDIYYGDGKIAGILIENVLLQGFICQSIIGTGINVNQTVFLSETPNPISLAQITGHPWDRMAIMDDFRQAFAEQSERLNNSHFDAIHADYLAAIYRKDGYFRYRDAEGAFEAVIRDIKPTGHLVLARTDGTLSQYAYKEVSYQ